MWLSTHSKLYHCAWETSTASLKHGRVLSCAPSLRALSSATFGEFRFSTNLRPLSSFLYSFFFSAHISIPLLLDYLCFCSRVSVGTPILMSCLSVYLSWNPGITLHISTVWLNPVESAIYALSTFCSISSPTTMDPCQVSSTCCLASPPPSLFLKEGFE